MKKIHGVATSYKILPGLARGKVLRNPQNYYLKSSYITMDNAIHGEIP